MFLVNDLKKRNLNDRNAIFNFLKIKENYESLGLQEIIPIVIENNRLNISFLDKEIKKYAPNPPVKPCIAEDCIIKWNGELQIKDFDQIVFRNVVFFGNLFIWLRPGGCRFPLASVTFDNVIVFGNVRFLFYPGKIEEIYIGASAIDDVSCSGIQLCDKFMIDESSIGCVSFENVKINELELDDSRIEAIRIKDDVLFQKKKLCRTKFDIKTTFDLKQKEIKWKSLPENPYGVNYKKTMSLTELENDEITCKNTYAFLTSFPTGISLKDSAAITNWKLFHDNEKSIAIIHKILDWLLTPKKVIGFISLIIFLCAWFYAGKEFYVSYLNKFEILNCCQALYYSAVSFTTIGYGDFVAKDFAVRIISTLEGLLGVLFGGAFLVALTRTYLDFHNDKFKN